MLFAVVHNSQHVLKHRLRVILFLAEDQVRIEEAGMMPGVAGSSDLIDSGKQRVQITVRGNGAHILEMAARLSLYPELPPAS